MGLNTIGAPGQPLPSPQALYPITINNQPQLSATNRVSLPPGGSVLVPAGTWNIATGGYAMLQAFDPVTDLWTPCATSDASSSKFSVSSDGTNYRMYNPLGFVIGAIITNGGTGFTSAPTVSFNIGGATAVALVGGSIGGLDITTVLSSAGLSTMSGGSGAGYSVPPVINIAAPPSPGVQATAVCAISGGALSSFTIVNPGAGYTSAPAVTVVPQPLDQNQVNAVAGFRPAGVTARLSGVGQVTAVLVTNPGNNPLTVAPAITFAGGGGSSAAATAVVPRTIVNYTQSVAGSGYSTGAVGAITFGGNIATQSSGLGSQTNNPAVSTQLVQPRQTTVELSFGAAGLGGGTVNSGISDGGVFTAVPQMVTVPQTAGAVGTMLAVLGSVNDTVFITPA